MEAADDFVAIIEYIQKDNQKAADRVAHKIYSDVTSLEKFPERGRPGRLPGTRDLVLSPLPYVLVYRSRSGFIEIVRILHGSQRWP
jgi:toxin ParE1/3/4